MKYIWDENVNEFVKEEDNEIEVTVIASCNGSMIPISKIPLEIAYSLGGEALYFKVKQYHENNRTSQSK